eukprot:TRINITY_DN22106_c0_g1_i1.p1 TRINITY_DN22106_c0_g1~~TRINITY_DN22106_c0_g1_i1.p1  ORF type:complete len:363 (-),score=74.93 TRINITY_DN22106_c0_g1_i1:283-1371(-)
MGRLVAGPPWPVEPLSEEADASEAEGWLATSTSGDWLYNPANRVFFHNPSETLWKRLSCGAGGVSAEFVCISEADRGDRTDGSPIKLLSAAQSLASPLQACFAAWRLRVQVFRDLPDASAEQPMPRLPLSSAPGVHPRSGEAEARCEATRPEPPPAQSSSWFLAAQLAALKFPWSGAGDVASSTRASSPEAPAGAEAARPQQWRTLRPATLARHNLDYGAEAVTSPLPLKARRASSLEAAEEISWGTIAAIHKDREAAWRCRVDAGGLAAPVSQAGARAAAIDESFRLEEGTAVLYGVKGRQGSVRRACPERDEYLVMDSSGAVVRDRAGGERRFRGDDLTALAHVWDDADLEVTPRSRWNA